jgi:RimJ/RimL family protein N-acetyltransferase
MIFFGGSDPSNMTRMSLDALSAPELSHLEVDVVIGANNRHRADLEQAIAERPLTHSYGHRAHLADLMAQADLAIGAGGATTWERLCLGLPSVVISIAENQEPACRTLSQMGLVRYLGDHGRVQPSMIANALMEFMTDPDALVDVSVRSQLTVDGLGAPRLAESLDPTPAQSLRLRPATADDLLLYFGWVNDPDVRRQAIHTEEIAMDRHQDWFAARLAAPDSHLFVMCAGNLPVGQVRFDRDGSEARIDYSLEPLFRGRGWAKHLMALGMQQMLSCGPIVFRADVKQANLSSRAVFTRMGFAESASSDGSGLVSYRFDPARHGIVRTN